MLAFQTVSNIHQSFFENPHELLLTSAKLDPPLSLLKHHLFYTYDTHTDLTFSLCFYTLIHPSGLQWFVHG